MSTDNITKIIISIINTTIIILTLTKELLQK